VTRVTGRSLSVSTVILMVILFGINAVVLKVGGRVGGPIGSHAFCVLFLFMLWRVSRVVKAYGNAFAARDFAEVTRLREIIEGKGEPKSKAMRALKRVGDAELLLQFEKWKEAAEVFATIELDDLPEIARPGIMSE